MPRNQSDTHDGESPRKRRTTAWHTPLGGSLRNTVPIPGSSSITGWSILQRTLARRTQFPANHNRIGTPMENYVPVLTTSRRPLAPCHPSRAKSWSATARQPSDTVTVSVTSSSTRRTSPRSRTQENCKYASTPAPARPGWPSPEITPTAHEPPPWRSRSNTTARPSKAA